MKVDYIEIKGGNPLKGEIPFETSKNAVLPIMAGALLCENEIVIEQIPLLSDVFVMGRILQDLGCNVKFTRGNLTINSQSLFSNFPKGELCQKLRASSLLIGGLLNKFDTVTIPRSGGCKIGARPIDIIAFTIFQSNTKAARRKRTNELREQKWLNVIINDIACEITVAKAEPLIPSPNLKIKSGFSIRFIATAVRIIRIDFCG